MKPLFVALSGGGAHAAAHAGALIGLQEAGIPVAGLAGVSGGALVAAAWAGGADLRSLVQQASALHPWTWSLALCQVSRFGSPPSMGIT